MNSFDDWGDLIEQYCLYLVAIGRPKTTIKTRRSQLRHHGRSLNIHYSAVVADDIVGWFGIQEWLPETRRSYRSAIRGFYAWATESGHIVNDPSTRLKPVKLGQPVPRPAPDAVWNESKLAANPRAILMLRLAAECGLRRAEVAKVHTRDLRIGDRGAQLIVHGKGSRERVVPMNADLAGLIRLGAPGHTPGTPANSWLFPGNDHGHLSPESVGRICTNVMPGVWTLHALRHRFATRAYRGTQDIRAVQRLLGHSSLAVTERYVMIDDDEMRAAMEAAAVA